MRAGRWSCWKVLESFDLLSFEFSFDLIELI